MRLFVRGALLSSLILLGTCTYTSNGPVLGGQDVHLTVIHTSDVHSRVLPYDFTPNKFDQQNGLLPTLAPFGGAARMATLIRRERAKSSRAIHLDSGDFFQGAPIFNAFSGTVETRAMSTLGVDAAALGNHEFDKGAANVALQLSKWAGFPVMAANYLFNDPAVPGNNTLGSVIKPYTILDADGLKVGVIGMANISSISQLVQGGNSLGVIPMDTDQTIEYYADLLRPQVDLLVAVSHLGLDEDETTATTNQGMQAASSSQVRGDVDVVFGGHLHIVLSPPKQIPIFVETPTGPQQTNRHTVLVHSGAFAKTFGRLDLIVHVNTPDEMKAQYEADKAVALALGSPIPTPRRGFVKAYDYKIIPVTARQPVDGEMCVAPNEDASGQSCTPPADPGRGYCRAATPGGQRKDCSLAIVSGPGSDCSGPGDECLGCVYCGIPEDGAMLNIVEPYALAMNASPNFQLTRIFANNAVTGGILRNNLAGGDSQLGNLVATAMQLQPDVQADFSMTNSLGIRADFSQGPLTIEELFNVFPFDNSIEIMYLSGIEVQEMFDFIAAKSASRGCKTQAQLSGAAFVMDCSVPPHRPNGESCDPGLYKNSENLGLCYQGAADLVLIGSNRSCASDLDCQGAGNNTSEICGSSLGFCLLPPPQKGGSRAICSLAKPTCPGSETCTPSRLNVCGKLLNPLGDYRVAVNDYVAAGGSGFTMLQFNTAKVNTHISLRDALIDYLQRLDNPLFEGPYGCNGTPSATSCHGAIRCDDDRWATDPYLQLYGTVTPDVTYRYCPGKTSVGDCFGHQICVLPHNQAPNGRVQPRFQ